MRQRQMRFLKNVAHLINYIFDSGYQCTAGEMFRTEYQQKEYLRTGYTKTLDSQHLKRLAVDLNIFDNEVLLFKEPLRKDKDMQIAKMIADYWEGLHPDNVAGFYFKNFNDFGHFEMKG